MKTARIFIVKIFEIFLGFLEEDVNYVFPIYYDMRKSFLKVGDAKYIERVWGFASVFSFRGKDIKITDLSALWNLNKEFHKFKYLLIFDDYGIRLDDLIDIREFSLEDIYIFPKYLQKLLKLEYIWGTLRMKKSVVYLIDPEILKRHLEGTGEKIL